MTSAEQLAETIRAIRDRVRSRYPQPGQGTSRVTLTDVMPLVHARDAAEGKVAAIGTVNPRRGGPVNWVIQVAKRAIARVLDWHVREQVEFNRTVISSLDAAIETFNEVNRALSEMSSQIEPLKAEAEELKDIRSHWVEWRAGWEARLAESEIKLFRSVAELQAAFQHRLTLAEGRFEEKTRLQHADFTAALERAQHGFVRAADDSNAALQKRFWSELDAARLEMERLIHNQLRLLRQRPAVQASPAASAEMQAALAWPFSDRFRGSEESVRERQRCYLPRFAGRRRVLDAGCGRGEFLDLMREAGVRARGIDLSAESVAACRSRGLEVEEADLFAYLSELGEGTLDGIFCAQVVEHLPPARLPEFVRLAAWCLERDGLLAIETPNPACLAIFATHFYLDPTHTRPVPHQLLTFYMEEYGLGLIQVEPLSPAVESMPALASLPADFREAFFGGLDYAIFGRKL